MVQLDTALRWLSVSLLVIIGVVLFVLYFRGTFRDRVEYKIKNVPPPRDPRFPLALASLSNSVTTHGRLTGFWVEADAINAARIAAIQSAQHTIHFETFFMTPGRRVNDLADALIEKAQAGIEVEIVVDHHGSKKLSRRYWQRLRRAGINIHFYNNFDWKSPVDYFARTHRKLLLIDGKVGLIGGAGISDFWDGIDNIQDNGPWYDFEMRWEGEVVAALAGMFMQHWTYVRGTADLDPRVFHLVSNDDPTVLVTAGDDPSYRASSIRALFQVGISAAKQRVWIASPYFIPDDNLQRELVFVKKRGVDIRILTNGSQCDKKFVYYASCELYGELLDAGVEIYEYQPSMMHAKALLLDRDWVSSGSANFDPRSFFHNDELDVSSADRELIQNIEQLFLQGFSRSKQISKIEWCQRPTWQRILGRIVLFFQSQL